MAHSSQTCLITGATSGIGRATARELAAGGARVIIHGRSAASAERTRRQLLDELPGARIETVHADLCSLDEVRCLAADVRERFPDLTVLVNNAGVERWERHVTPDGFEETWAVNQLAPFLLSALLLPVLRDHAPARIINVSSVVHRFGRLDWDDLQLSRDYGAERAYYRSKLAAVAASLELARRCEQDRVAVLLLAPGLVRTAFARDFRGAARLWSKTVGRWLSRPPEAVAREIADLALGAQWRGQTGLYVSRGRVERPSTRASEPALQLRVWEASAAAVGLSAAQLPEASPAVSAPVPALRRWIGACTAGELLGFGAAALWAWLAHSLFGANPLAWSTRLGVLGLMVLAGICEGLVLGLLQWLVLRAWFPSLRAHSWLLATATVAGAGWLLGMLPSTVSSPSTSGAALQEPPLWLTLGFASLFGAAAGALFGLAQWLVLRRHAYDARAWISANSAGWALGLPWSYLAGSSADVGRSLPLAVLWGVAGGALMGLSVALFTGRALLRIAPRRALLAPPAEWQFRAHPARAAAQDVPRLRPGTWQA
jgi:NAD(P)-dependent dehydrogenase (short-subunit alcohol dehydrogenase family)